MKLRVSGKMDSERFDKAVRRLLTVSYAELQRRLAADKKAKKKRKSAKTSAASRASGERI